MGNYFHKDIVNKIGSYVPIKQIIRQMTLLNKDINQCIKETYWSHEIVNLRFHPICILEWILDTYNFTRVDMSNSMITDEINTRLDNRSELIVQNCFSLTDKFVDRIPLCTSLDITNCVNIRGDFLAYRPKWSKLKLSGCFFIGEDKLLQLIKCDILDLTQTIFPYVDSDLIGTLASRCEEIFIEDGSIVAKARGESLSDITDKFKSLSNVTKPQIHYEWNNRQRYKTEYVSNYTSNYKLFSSPNLEYICYDKSICNNFDKYITKSKLQIESYVRERCVYASSIKKFADPIHDDIRKYDVTKPFFDLVNETNTFNVFGNKLFFSERTLQRCRMTSYGDIHYHYEEQNKMSEPDSKITKLPDGYYYHNNILDDILEINITPSNDMDERVDPDYSQRMTTSMLNDLKVNTLPYTKNTYSKRKSSKSNQYETIGEINTQTDFHTGYLQEFPNPIVYDGIMSKPEYTKQIDAYLAFDMPSSINFLLEMPKEKIEPLSIAELDDNYTRMMDEREKIDRERSVYANNRFFPGLVF